MVSNNDSPPDGAKQGLTILRQSSPCGKSTQGGYVVHGWKQTREFSTDGTNE